MTPQLRVIISQPTTSVTFQYDLTAFPFNTRAKRFPSYGNGSNLTAALKPRRTPSKATRVFQSNFHTELNRNAINPF